MTRYCLLVSWFIFFEILISLFLFFVLLGEHWTLPHGDVRMFNNIMSDPTVLFPLLVGLWLTCWTQGKKNAHWGLEVASTGSATGIYTYLSIYIGLCITYTSGRWMEEISQTRIGRRLRDRPVVPAVELGDWKPIDYGHPMRDPTLVYGIYFTDRYFI